EGEVPRLERLVDVDGQRRPHLVLAGEEALRALRVGGLDAEADDLARLLARDGRGVAILGPPGHGDRLLLLLLARAGHAVAQLDRAQPRGGADVGLDAHLLVRGRVSGGEADAGDDGDGPRRVVGVPPARGAARPRRAGAQRRGRPVLGAAAAGRADA